MNGPPTLSEEKTHKTEEPTLHPSRSHMNIISNSQVSSSYIKYRNDELNKELIEKASLLKSQEEKIKSLELALKNYKKNTENLNQKLSSQDNMYIELNSMKNAVNELENQSKILKKENMRLQEIIKKKEGIISQFQNLVELSSSKFKLFEDTNDTLRKKIDELERNEKVNLGQFVKTNNQLNEQIKDLEYQLENIQNDALRNQDIARKKFEEKMKAREEEHLSEISKISATCESLKTEIKSLHGKNEDYDSLLKNKEAEFKRAIDLKEREHDKLVASLRDVQNDLEEVEHNYSEKLEYLKKKTIDFEQEANSIKMQALNKTKEIEKLNQLILEFNATLKESERELKTKDTTIANLSKENAKLTKQINDKDCNLLEIQNNSIKNTEMLQSKIRMLEKEKESLMKEKDQDTATLREKIYEFQNTSKSRLSECYDMDRRYKDLCKSFEYKEEEYFQEISRLQTIIKEREQEGDNMKVKYEKIIHLKKLNIEELENRVRNLINSMITLKEYARAFEKKLLDNDDAGMITGVDKTDFDSSPLRVKQNTLQMIDSLRELISKIDSKIGTPKKIQDVGNKSYSEK